MARTVRQKRRNRSSRPRVQTHTQRRKQLNPTGNSIVAQNWNKTETLSQNYRRLGLVTRLQKNTGGTEPLLSHAAATSELKPSLRRRRRDPLAIDNASTAGVGSVGGAGNAVREMRIERDADGRIVRVLDGAAGRPNPFGDALNALDSDSDSDSDGDGDGDGAWGGFADEEEDEESRPAVIRALEAEAARTVLKTPRHQSERESEWLQRLVEVHGAQGFEAMARDRRLNPMQQTAADLRRRIRKLGLAE